jgi:hypothetical protein
MSSSLSMAAAVCIALFGGWSAAGRLMGLMHDSAPVIWNRHRRLCPRFVQRDHGRAWRQVGHQTLISGEGALKRSGSGAHGCYRDHSP